MKAARNKRPHPQCTTTTTTTTAHQQQPWPRPKRGLHITIAQFVSSDGFGDAAAAFLLIDLLRTRFPIKTPVHLWMYFAGIGSENEERRLMVAGRMKFAKTVASSSSSGIVATFNTDTATNAPIPLPQFIDQMKNDWIGAFRRIVSVLSINQNPDTTWAFRRWAQTQVNSPFCCLTEYNAGHRGEYGIDYDTCLPHETCILTGPPPTGEGFLLPLDPPARTTRQWHAWVYAECKLLPNSSGKPLDLFVVYTGCSDGAERSKLEHFIRRHATPGKLNVVIAPKCKGAIAECYCLQTHPNEIWILPSAVQFGSMRSLMRISNPWVFVTGDQSLIEAVAEGKFIQYERPVHKRDLWRAYEEALKQWRLDNRVQFPSAILESDMEDPQFEPYRDDGTAGSPYISHEVVKRFSQDWLARSDLLAETKSLARYMRTGETPTRFVILQSGP
jgi:hypothetical protein